MNEKNLIKIIDEIKNKTSLDLSSGEDLTIGIMNLISLEEHFLFSYMKTENEKFLEFLEQIREIRKKLLLKIVKKDENDYSEKWCITKHLLSSSMRFMEVGTKYLHEKKEKEAKEFFEEAFNLYSLAWFINGLSDFKNDFKEKKLSDSKLSKISQLVKKMLDCCKE